MLFAENEDSFIGGKSRFNIGDGIEQPRQQSTIESDENAQLPNGSTVKGLLAATGICCGMAGAIEGAAHIDSHPVAGWAVTLGSVALAYASGRLAN